jgi:hypothetical protein
MSGRSLSRFSSFLTGHSIALKAYDVWDNNKICRYPDSFDDICHTEEAWLTSGNEAG